MRNVHEKIKEFRKQKGYSYETMAHEMHASAGAYRKIELNETQLSLKRLYQIAEILDTKVEDLLSLNSETEFNQTNNENATGYQQQIENFYQENKEKSEKIEQLYELRLKDKEDLISQLKMIVERLSK